MLVSCGGLAKIVETRLLRSTHFCQRYALVLTLQNVVPMSSEVRRGCMSIECSLNINGKLQIVHPVRFYC